MRLNFQYQPWIYGAVKEHEQGKPDYIPGVIVVRGMTDLTDVAGKPENAPHLVTKPIVIDAETFKNCIECCPPNRSYFARGGILNAHGTEALKNYGSMHAFTVQHKLFSLVLLNEDLEEKLLPYISQVP
jgi:hypothetical protein